MDEVNNWEPCGVLIQRKLKYSTTGSPTKQSMFYNAQEVLYSTVVGCTKAE